MCVLSWSLPQGNSKYFAVNVGRGTLCVWDYAKKGKLPPLPPSFTGHKGAVLDFDFNPFHDDVICSGSDDAQCKVWKVPEGGLTECISEPLCTLSGHQRKVAVVRFNPCADNVLATLFASLLQRSQ